MSGFFQNLLTDTAASFFGSDYLRDYTHASKTFRPNAYQHAPKYKFLFHVYFDINPAAYNQNISTGSNFGLEVKSAKLPSYSFDTHVLNQYNRKRIVQTKIKYDTIDIDFHDDNGNMIRNLWYAYYTYYYKDATKPMGAYSANQAAELGAIGINTTGKLAADYNSRTIYNPTITGDTDWGYIGETAEPVTPTNAAMGQTKVPFFRNINIYGFNQHNFVKYTLVNPIITRFAHDIYSYADNAGIMENKMSLDYETVVYSVGALDGRTPSNIVTGFAENENYDRTVSPISRPGSQSTILGQGGLVDGVGGFIDNLASGNILGAIQAAGTTYNTAKNMNIKQTIKSDLLAGIQNSTQATPNRNSIFQFPSSGTTPGIVGTAGAALSSVVSSAAKIVKGP
jgi:hypothetical protein